LSWVELALFLAGTGLLAYLIRRIGVPTIAGALARLGFSLPLIISVEGLAVLANTVSWRCTIPPERRSAVPFGRLVVARIVGDAVNYVIPAGAGEVPKIRFLSRYIPTELAIASVALAKLTEGIALGIFAILGLVVSWPILVANAVSGVMLALTAAVGAGLVVACLVAARAGLATAVVRLFRRVVATQRDRVHLTETGEALDAEIALLRQGLVASTFWHLVGWFVNVAELWLACHFLDLGASLGVVFSGEALGVLFDAMFFFVPMRIGAAEGGRAFLFRVLGLGAGVGLTLGLVRRIRELAWTAAGLAIYPWLARVDGPAPECGPDRDQRRTVAVT
jgi:hypothetical protein